MDKHFVGHGQNSGEDSSASMSEETSLAVRQFCAVAFGWQPVHFPSQPWKVERVDFDERYCKGCFGVRGHDVVIGASRGFPADMDPQEAWYKFSIRPSVSYCRCCGAEVMR